MKLCKKCNIYKPLTMFYANKKCLDKKSSWCKVCSARSSKESYHRRKHIIKASGDYRKRKAKADKAYKERYPERIRARKRARNKRVRKATPPWLTSEQKRQIEAIYLECRQITDKTGIQHHVDHIHPLNGKNCCGLHVPWNLQIIPAKENIKKSNHTTEIKND